MQVKSLSTLDSSTDKKLSNAFSYDMLLNSCYTEPFAYVPVYLKDRLSYIASPDDDPLTKKCQSDYVRFVVDFA